MGTDHGKKLNWWRWSRASCLRMSVDILGANCDQCRSTVQCCFTSTETVRLIRTVSTDGHLDFHRAPELWKIERGGKHCMAATCVNKTLAPKPRTDNTRINKKCGGKEKKMRRKKKEKKIMNRQQRKQAHKPTGTQLYRGGGGGGGRGMTRKKKKEGSCWPAHMSKQCRKKRKKRRKRATCKWEEENPVSFFTVNTTTTISVYGKNGWWRALRVCVCVWSTARRLVSSQNNNKKTVCRARPRKQPKYVKEYAAQCYQMFFLL